MAEELIDEFDEQPAAPSEIDLVRQLMAGKQMLAIAYLDSFAERHQARADKATEQLNELETTYDSYADDEGAEYELIAARLDRELALIEHVFGLERSIEANELDPQRVDRFARRHRRDAFAHNSLN